MSYAIFSLKFFWYFPFNLEYTFFPSCLVVFYSFFGSQLTCSSTWKQAFSPPEHCKGESLPLSLLSWSPWGVCHSLSVATRCCRTVVLMVPLCVSTFAWVMKCVSNMSSPFLRPSHSPFFLSFLPSFQLLLLLLGFLKHGVSLCSCGCPGTPCVDQAGFGLPEIRLPLTFECWD